MSETSARAPRPSGNRRERQPGRGAAATGRAGGVRPNRQGGGRGPRGLPAVSIGENWWTARWLAALERLGWSMRLQRGQAYARAGNVLRIDVQPGQVTAAVKGTQPKPYRVIIRIQPLTDDEWDRVMNALASQALFAARLLAGEMPPTIEDAFAEAGVTLFPTSTGDLYATCSCPDWANPCKHVAAVHYMLGAEFDRDPFLLFWLRGRSRQQIIQALRAKRTIEAPASPELLPATAEEEVAPAELSLPPLEECLEHFWQPGPSLKGEQFTIERPEVPESVLRRLGQPSFWRGEYDVLPVLIDAYRTVSREALALATGKEPVDRPGPATQTQRPPERLAAGHPPRPHRGPDRHRRPAEPPAAPPQPSPEGHRRPPRRRWSPRPRRTEPPAAAG